MVAAPTKDRMERNTESRLATHEVSLSPLSPHSASATKLQRRKAERWRGWIDRGARQELAGPNSWAYYLNHDNTRRGRHASVDAASFSGQTFTIALASDVFAFDLDDERQVAAGHDWAEKVRADDRPVLFVASGRPGHEHLWCVVHADQHRALWVERAKARGLNPRQEGEHMRRRDHHTASCRVRVRGMRLRPSCVPEEATDFLAAVKVERERDDRQPDPLLWMGTLRTGRTLWFPSAPQRVRRRSLSCCFGQIAPVVQRAMHAASDWDTVLLRGATSRGESMHCLSRQKAGRHLAAAGLVIGLAAATLSFVAPQVAGASTSPSSVIAARIAAVEKCLNGGYVNYSTPSGKPFKNAVDCVVYAALGGTLVGLLPDLVVIPSCSSSGPASCTLTVENIGTGPVKNGTVLVQSRTCHRSRRLPSSSSRAPMPIVFPPSLRRTLPLLLLPTPTRQFLVNTTPQPPRNALGTFPPGSTTTLVLSTEVDDGRDAGANPAFLRRRESEPHDCREQLQQQLVQPDDRYVARAPRGPPPPRFRRVHDDLARRSLWRRRDGRPGSPGPLRGGEAFESATARDRPPSVKGERDQRGTRVRRDGACG